MPVDNEAFKGLRIWIEFFLHRLGNNPSGQDNVFMFYVYFFATEVQIQVRKIRIK